MTRSDKRSSRAGAPDVVQLLERQHGEIRRAFRRALLPGVDRATAFQRLVRLLAVHEAAEEAHVHPVARKVIPDGRKVIRSRVHEEKQAKRLLAELERMGPGAAGFQGKLWALRKAVLAHAKQEERIEFPALRRNVTAVRRRSLGMESRVTQALAPTHPHPAVNSQLANKFAAPIFGPMDRGRDLVRGLFGRH